MIGEVLGITGRIQGERRVGLGLSNFVLALLCGSRSCKTIWHQTFKWAGMKRLLASRIPKEESTNRNYSISRGRVHRLTIMSNQWNTALISLTRALLCINKSARAKTASSCTVNLQHIEERGALYRLQHEMPPVDIGFIPASKDCKTWPWNLLALLMALPRLDFHGACIFYFFNKKMGSLAKKPCLCTFNSVHVTVITFIS